MGILHSFFAILLLLLITIGVWEMGGYVLLGVILPYAGVLLFIVGFIYRILKWAGSPVPFPIVTVLGQQKSLPWIKDSKIDSPSSTEGVVARLALEMLFFRSLLRNETVKSQGPQKLFFKPSTALWLGAIAFHWSFLIILLRHMRFFLEPVPSIITWIQRFDAILQGLFPILYLTDIILWVALGFLFLRRVISPQIRYISLAPDYFVLLLLLGISATGILMRLVYPVDLAKVKEWAMAMLSFHPKLPAGVGLPFYIHLFFVSLFMAYFPLSKLMHMGGIFLSPTRNLRNMSRHDRHINPWNHPVKIRSYQEYEEEFRLSMKEVGLPVDGPREAGDVYLKDGHTGKHPGLVQEGPSSAGEKKE